MNVWVTILVAVIGSGILNTLLNCWITRQDRKKEEDSGVKRALRLLMKDRLRFLCGRYIDQKWIYEDELEDLISMYKCYHSSLDGNGYLDKLMERVQNLEIRGIGVK